MHVDDVSPPTTKPPIYKIVEWKHGKLMDEEETDDPVFALGYFEAAEGLGVVTIWKDGVRISAVQLLQEAQIEVHDVDEARKMVREW